MTEYQFPFKSQDFDIIYTNIAETLKVSYPQNGDSIQDWYKRLLFELMSHVQSEFEPEEIEEVIKPKNKNNKRKNKKKDINSKAVVQESIFTDTIDRCLEIIYQDSNFAIYLLSWFLPILVKLTDTFEVDINIDNSETPAENVVLRHVHLFIEQGIFKVTILINGIDISHLTKSQYESFSIDPFLSQFLKSISLFKTGGSETYVTSNVISYDGCDPQLWSFRLSRFLWDIKNVLTPFYIDNIEFKTNLEPEVVTTLKKDKANKKKNNRKRFNEQKYLTSVTATQDQMASHVIRSLFVATFRTYYDFDEDTISVDLYDYLFKKKPLSY
jgi:hypothetical protein